MLTEYEARKLQGEMKHELNATTGVVLTCAVMLLLLIGLAWFGAANAGPANRDSAPPSTPPMTTGAPDFC